jgi:hypothetical protein
MQAMKDKHLTMPLLLVFVEAMGTGLGDHALTKGIES